MEYDNNLSESEGEFVVDVKSASLKDITLDLIRRVTHLSSVELRGGFWTVMTDKDGKEKRIYIPDTREALTNAIFCLVQMLRPRFDKDMEKKFKDFKVEIEQREEDFLKKTSIKETEILGEDYYQGKDRTMLEEFKIRKVKIYFELWYDINNFLARKPVLGGAGGVF